MKKKIKLITASLKYFRFRNLFILLIILCTDLSVFLSFSFINGAKTGIRNAKDRLGADIVVTSAEEDVSAEDILFNGQPATEFLDNSYAEKIKQTEYVTNVVSRLYIASLSGASCCDGQIQLIGTDYKDDFLLKAWLDIKELKDDEIILGKNFMLSPGDTVKYYGRTFTVAAILPKMNSSYDSSGFITTDMAKEILNDEEYTDLFSVNDVNNVTSMIFVSSDNPNITYNILKSTYGGEISVYVPDKKISEYTASIRLASAAINAMTVIIGIICLIAMLSIFSEAAHDRKKEIGNLYLIGYKKKDIFRMFAAEHIICIGTAFIISSVTFLLISTMAVPFMERADIPFCLNAKQIPIIMLAAFLANIFMALVAEIIAMHSILKESPAVLIKEGY